jgi:hypothetical protein
METTWHLIDLQEERMGQSAPGFGDAMMKSGLLHDRPTRQTLAVNLKLRGKIVHITAWTMKHKTQSLAGDRAANGEE